MSNSFEPNEDNMRKAKIVLGDALPYELLMLDAAARFTTTSQFEGLKIREELFDWLICNGTVEAFWTHARCLLEFFNGGKMTISMRVPRPQEISLQTVTTRPKTFNGCGVRDVCQSKSTSRLVTSVSSEKPNCSRNLVRRWDG